MWEQLKKRTKSVSADSPIGTYKIVLIAFAFIVSWIAIIGLFGRPVLDDISFAISVPREGQLGYIKYHLMTANGRVADALTISLLYGNFSVNSVPYAGLLACAALLSAFITAYRFIFRGIGMQQILLLSFGSIVASYLLLQVPYHTFYWMPAMFTYVLPISFIVILLRALMGTKMHPQPLKMFVLCCGLIIVGTFNELLTIISITGIFLWWLVSNHTKKYIQQAVPAVTSLLVAFAVMYFAPGSIARRTAAKAGDNNAVALLAESLNDAVQLLIATITRPGIIVVIIMTYLLIQQGVVKKFFNNHHRLHKLIVFLCLYSVVSLIATTLIANYTNSVEGGLAAPRTHVYFTVILVAATTVSIAAILARVFTRLSHWRYVFLSANIVAVALVIMLGALALPMLRDDAIQLTGRYHLWKQREISIYQQKALGIKSPIVEPLPIELLNDVMPTRHFYNDDLANYYGVKSLISAQPLSLWYREY